jgi:TDG/mug DNA glycosylase family protein
VVLPDVLAANLKVVFCGTQAGAQSARVGAYYAGRGNRFYETLYRVGLTPRKLEPPEYRLLLTYGIGLTDIAKHTSGADKTLRSEHFDADGLRKKMVEYAPRVLAFNGKRAAQTFYATSVTYGLQHQSIGEIRVFVLPSTSGAARMFWDERYWRELAAHLADYP